jgi:hypothetical protein
MLGDYPTRGRKYRVALALIALIGLVGIVLMFTVGGVTKE